MTEVNLRNATSEDEQLLLKWRNLDELVALSYLQKKVTPEEHHIWFQSKLNCSDSMLLIVQIDSLNIGLIRIDSEYEICDISIYLIPGYEGQGYGSLALKKALKSGAVICKSYTACVQVGNISSKKLFEKLGFIESSVDENFISYKKTDYL